MYQRQDCAHGRDCEQKNKMIPGIRIENGRKIIPGTNNKQEPPKQEKTAQRWDIHTRTTR